MGADGKGGRGRAGADYLQQGPATTGAEDVAALSKQLRSWLAVVVVAGP